MKEMKPSGNEIRKSSHFLYTIHEHDTTVLEWFQGIALSSTNMT